MIGITSKGEFTNTLRFINRVMHRDIYRNLERYGQRGVDALSSATPIDTGLTAKEWKYRVIMDRNPRIEWYNTNEEYGVSVAILIQYGHGTGTGGYVAGRDFINPAIRPIFDQIANDVWKEVRT